MLLSALANALLQMLNFDAVWRYQAGCVPFVFACPVLLVVWTVPESPRWMLQTVGSSPSSLLAVLEEISSLRRPGARKRLETWRSGRGYLEELSSDADTEGQDDLIRLWDDKHLAAGSPLYRSDSKLEDEAVRLRTLPILQRTLKDVCAIIVGSQQVPAGARRGLGLALAAAVLNQACASTSILIYAEKMLASVGFGQESQDLLTLMVIGAKMLGVILGLVIVERVSRRTLLGAGGGLSAVALLVIALGAAWRSPVLLVHLGEEWHELLYCHLLQHLGHRLLDSGCRGHCCGRASLLFGRSVRFHCHTVCGWLVDFSDLHRCDFSRPGGASDVRICSGSHEHIWILHSS